MQFYSSYFDSFCSGSPLQYVSTYTLVELYVCFDIEWWWWWFDFFSSVSEEQIENFKRGEMRGRVDEKMERLERDGGRMERLLGAKS